MADPFRDPQGMRACAADIFCMLYRPLRGIEKDGCPPYRIPTRKFRRARAGASSQAAIGRRCRFAVATEPCREPPTLGNAPFPSYKTARSPRFCVAAPAQPAGDPGISSRSKGINRAMCPCGPRRSFAARTACWKYPQQIVLHSQKTKRSRLEGVMTLYQFGRGNTAERITALVP